MSGIHFAMLAGLSMGLWAAFTKLASGSINAAWAAAIVSIAAAAFGIIKLASTGQIAAITSPPPKIFLFLILTGAAAFALDYFGLKAYDTGLPLNVGGPIIIGVGILATALVGALFMGETVTLAKATGTILILAGAVLLSR